MSNNYDNWERLVDAVLRRERDREVALADSRESSFGSISSSSSFRPDSSFHEQNPQLEAYDPNSNAINLFGGKKLKIVIHLSINDNKYRSKVLRTVVTLLGLLTFVDKKYRFKAMRTAIALSGVESVALTGDTMEVTGDGIDAVKLTMLLRKKVGPAAVLSIGAFKVEKA